MKHLREQLQALQTEEVVNKLIDKSIEDKIKTGTYSPKEEWSPGSEEMIRSFSRCAIDHQFEQAVQRAVQDIVHSQIKNIKL